MNRVIVTATMLAAPGTRNGFDKFTRTYAFEIADKSAAETLAIIRARCQATFSLEFNGEVSFYEPIAFDLETGFEIQAIAIF